MVTCTTPPFRAAVRLNSGVRQQERTAQLLESAVERTVLLCVLAATSLLSVFLLLRHSKRDLSRSEGIVGVLLLLVPLVGPLLYWFLLNEVAPQDKILQNRGGRGSYTSSWIALKPTLDKILKDREDLAKRESSKE